MKKNKYTKVYLDFGLTQHGLLNGDRAMPGLSLRPDRPARHDPFLFRARPGQATPPKAQARPVSGRVGPAPSVGQV
jgi:hypothetical protein